MDSALVALCLGLFSAVTLASANVSVKMGGDILLSRALMSASAAVLILPALLLVPAPDRATWHALAFALPAHFFYEMCMIRALQRGDLSLVFPVMRGLAPLLTAFAALVFLHESLAPLAWLGLVLSTVAVAAFALPPRGKTIRDHPHASALLWAVGTAVGIALYNVTDARGVRAAPSPFTFITWLFLLDGLGVVLIALVLRRNVIATTLASRWRLGVAGGALSILSFGSALYAFGLMEPAKVSALRETSVVFAALMGSMFLVESFGSLRVMAAVVLTGGLVLMQFGR